MRASMFRIGAVSSLSVEIVDDAGKQVCIIPAQQRDLAPFLVRAPQIASALELELNHLRAIKRRTSSEDLRITLISDLLQGADWGPL